VPVHPGGDLAELGEVADRERTACFALRLGARQELKAHAMPLGPAFAALGPALAALGPALAALGYRHDLPPVAGGQHPWRAHSGLGAQGFHPGQLGRDLRLGVVAEPVHTQYRRPGVGVRYQEGRVL
jgi:hypothetical protein